MKNKFLKLMALFVASAFVGNAGAQTSPNSGVEVTEGDFYIYNLGASRYLAKGSSYGTHTTVDGAGTVVAISAVDGDYLIHFDGIAADAYLGNGGWVDCNSTRDDYSTYTFESVSLDGYTNVYKLKANNGGNYLYWPGGEGRYGNEALVGDITEIAELSTYWILIPKTTRENLANASSATPVDVTYYVTDPDMERDANADGQASSYWKGDFIKNFTAQEKCTANFLEKWAGQWVSNTSTTTSSPYKLKDYKAYQSLPTLPNGKYKLTISATAVNQDDATLEITGVYVYADDRQVPVSAANDYSLDFIVDGQSAVEIGVKTVSTTANWVKMDNVRLAFYGTLLKHDAVAFNSGMELAANVWYSYNVAQDTEFNIVAGTDLNNIVYITSDGAILTEEAEANAKEAFTSTQTLAAGTYYFKSSTAQTLSITPNVLPTTVTLSPTEIALNAASNTAELTATVGEAGAPQDVVWTSTNTDVATVVNGVVTGVTPGTTVVRATAYGYDNVYAEATVTVTYAETVVDDYYVNDGVKRTIYTHNSTNAIKNGTFDYPGYYGWKNAANKGLTTSKFEILTEEDGNKYLHGKTNEGTSAEGSIATSWSIEEGKTYEFGYKTKGNAGNTEYHKVSLTNNETVENTEKIISKTLTLTANWQQVRYQFTNTDGFAYLHFRARWLGENTDFDDFYLCEVTTSEEGNVDYITENVPTANVGEGAFQYSQTSIDAAKSLVQGKATVEDVQNAYDAMMTLNVPKDGAKYQIAISYDGYRYNGSAFTPNATPTKGIAIPVTNNSANVNYWNDFTFTSVDGVTNGYTISITSADGVIYYLCTGKQDNGTSEQQMRMTTNSENALTVIVKATATDGIYNLLNTRNNNATIGCQDDQDTDGGLYTTNAHNTITISEAEQAEVTLTVKETGWATLILPFNAEISDDITLYSCTEVSESNELVLVEAESIVANTPYIVKGVEGATKTYDFAGYGLATADTYTAGLLTGVYKQTTATANTYVLQNHDGEVAFYLVGEVLPEIGANRCFLTVQSATAPMFSLERGEGTTSIEDAELTNENVVIYDLAGRRVEKMEKGIYIVNGKKVIR